MEVVAYCGCGNKAEYKAANEEGYVYDICDVCRRLLDYYFCETTGCQIYHNHECKKGDGLIY